MELDRREKGLGVEQLGLTLFVIRSLRLAAAFPPNCSSSEMWKGAAKDATLCKKSARLAEC